MWFVEGHGVVGWLGDGIQFQLFRNTDMYMHIKCTGIKLKTCFTKIFAIVRFSFEVREFTIWRGIKCLPLVIFAYCLCMYIAFNHVSR